jgi:hypothetical protein
VVRTLAACLDAETSVERVTIALYSRSGVSNADVTRSTSTRSEWPPARLVGTELDLATATVATAIDT